MSANAFDLIGAAPADRPRFRAPMTTATARRAVAMLGHGVWRTRYGGDPGVLGKSIMVNGAPATVVGIAPDGSGFPATGEIWLTLVRRPDWPRSRAMPGRCGSSGACRTARRSPACAPRSRGSSTGSSRDYAPANRNLRARVMPINDRYFGRLGDPAWRAFIAAAFLVALISCANAANLMLARSVRRARELAIRSSLGATRRRLLRQLLIEGFVLAAAGGVFGLGVSLLGVQVFRSAIPEKRAALLGALLGGRSRDRGAGPRIDGVRDPVRPAAGAPRVEGGREPDPEGWRTPGRRPHDGPMVDGIPRRGVRARRGAPGADRRQPTAVAVRRCRRIAPSTHAPSSPRRSPYRPRSTPRHRNESRCSRVWKSASARYPASLPCRSRAPLRWRAPQRRGFRSRAATWPAASAPWSSARGISRRWTFR